MTSEKKVILIFAAITLIGFGYWFYLQAKPKPGQVAEDLGRGHVATGTFVDYKTNPPTSGPHNEDWTRSGVYDVVPDDGNLVHSLEHGYVIISYNCAVLKKTEQALPAASPVQILPPEFYTSECKGLVADLKKIIEDKGTKRLIVTPRPNLDTYIALTAWKRLEKLDSLDKGKINEFISALINEGPEKTME